MTHKLFLFALIALGLLCGCNKNEVYREHNGIAMMQWKKGEKSKFTVEIKDVSVPYDISVALRHTTSTQYGDINIKLTRHSPSGETLAKDYTLGIRDPKTGELYGSSMGDYCDTEVMVQGDVKFEQAGTYTFEVEHTMEESAIPLVMEVGLVVAKSPKQNN